MSNTDSILAVSEKMMPLVKRMHELQERAKAEQRNPTEAEETELNGIENKLHLLKLELEAAQRSEN